MSALQVLESPRGSDLQWWNMAKDQATMLVKTGFLPESIKTAEQAVAIMMKGRELGIPAMYALSNIVIIKGKPTCNSELMLALIYRDHGDAAMRIADSSNQACTIAYRRKGWPREQTYSFTVEDATRAGLMGTNTWKQYTAAMLRARCISAVARMAFPDSIAGMYTSEELGGHADIDDPGEGTITVLDFGTSEIAEPEPKAIEAEVVDEVEHRYEGGCTQAQLARVNILARDKGIDPEGIKRMHGKASAKLLTENEANKLIGTLEMFPDAEPVASVS